MATAWFERIVECAPSRSNAEVEAGGYRTSSLKKVTIRVDADTLAWFQLQGEAAEQRMAAALRIYAEAHLNNAECLVAPKLIVQEIK